MSGADPASVHHGVTVMAIAAWMLLVLVVVWHGVRRRRGQPEHRLSGKDLREVHVLATETTSGGQSYLAWNATALDVERRQLAHVSGRASPQAAFAEVLAMAAALDDTTPIDIPPPRPTEPPILAALRTTQDDDEQYRSGEDSPRESGATRPRSG